MTVPVLLVVEDCDDDAFLCDKAVTALSLKIRLQRVWDGAEAIRYLTGQAPYDDRIKHPLPFAILLDLHMPKLDGFEFLEWLHANPQFATLPVFVLTDRLDFPSVTRAHRLGATSVVGKNWMAGDYRTMAGEVKKAWMRQGTARETG